MTPFATLKQKILSITGEGNFINLAVAKQKAGLSMISTVADAEKVLKVLTKPKRITPPVSANVKQRYNEAHQIWFKQRCPEAYKDGHYTEPTMPKIFTGNGLNTFIENYLTWMGYRATRINVSGRKLQGKWIKSSTRTGSADVSSTINGRSVQWETKVGADKASPAQLREQQRERAAGGEYFFVKTAESFLNIFDQIVYG